MVDAAVSGSPGVAAVIVNYKDDLNTVDFNALSTMKDGVKGD